MNPEPIPVTSGFNRVDAFAAETDLVTIAIAIEGAGLQRAVFVIGGSHDLDQVFIGNNLLPVLIAAVVEDQGVSMRA
jgi:hypothetical protein